MTNIILNITIFQTKDGYCGRCDDLGLISDPARRKSVAIANLKNDLRKELDYAAHAGTLIKWLDRMSFVSHIGDDDIAVSVVDTEQISMALPKDWNHHTDVSANHRP